MQEPINLINMLSYDDYEAGIVCPSGEYLSGDGVDVNCSSIGRISGSRLSTAFYQTADLVGRDKLLLYMLPVQSV